MAVSCQSILSEQQQTKDFILADIFDIEKKKSNQNHNGKNFMVFPLFSVATLFYYFFPLFITKICLCLTIEFLSIFTEEGRYWFCFASKI